jgi:hypothetical protein
VSRYLESLSCHVWLTNSATVVSLVFKVFIQPADLYKKLTTEWVKPNVLNISFVVVVGSVDSVDNPYLPKNNRALLMFPVDNYKVYQHKNLDLNVIHSYPQAKQTTDDL